MSGIACIFNLNDCPASATLIRRMSAVSQHRGPDGVTHWNQGPVAFASLAFWTTPEAVHETQPLFDDTRSLCLVMDGRVDNRIELRSALESAGAVPRTDTDAELVLQAYQCWGDKCPSRIIGDFVFLVWDMRNHVLFCARDVLGIKPLYYYADNRRFLCASELHQLFECPEVPREPNEGMVGEYLVAAPTSCEETLYRGIMRLPPADCMTVQIAGIRKWRYWDIDRKRTLRYRRDDEYSEHFLELFSEAVRCRLRSHGRVGSELSGGLDSSSVVSMAQRLYEQQGLGNGGGFETFSLVFPGKACDEKQYIDAVVRKWNVDANFSEPLYPEANSYLDEVRRYQDFPDSPNGIMLHPLMALAREKGFRVILTGDGGDIWLDGSYYYSADLLRQLNFPALWQQLRFDSHNAGPRARLRHFLRYGLAPFLPARMGGMRWEKARLPDYIEEEFAHRIGLLDRIEGRIPKGSFSSFSQRDIYAMLTDGWRAHGNEIRDRALSWLGIEQRHPLNDRRIIEFAMALPEEHRRKPDQYRYILRQAMRGILPEIVRTRPDKGEFSHVLAKASQTLGNRFSLDSMAIASLGWVKPDTIRSRYQRMVLRYEADDPGYTEGIWNLWMVFGIEAWFRVVSMNGGA